MNGIYSIDCYWSKVQVPYMDSGNDWDAFCRPQKKQRRNGVKLRQDQQKNDVKLKNDLVETIVSSTSLQKNETVKNDEEICTFVLHDLCSSIRWFFTAFDRVVRRKKPTKFLNGKLWKRLLKRAMSSHRRLRGLLRWYSRYVVMIPVLLLESQKSVESTAVIPRQTLWNGDLPGRAR